jgi:putative SOS response-associated peptidase YedK
MCGRYTYFPGEFSDLRLTWKVDEVFGLKPRYNIAPSQDAPVIVQSDGKRKAIGEAPLSRFCRWLLRMAKGRKGQGAHALQAQVRGGSLALGKFLA